MTAFRRTKSNFSLQLARDLAVACDKPLIILEPLRIGYRWASIRMHQFVIEGMRDNAAAARAADVRYFPYVEPEPHASQGMIEALAANSAAVVTDDYPCFFHPALLRLAARRITAPLFAVDSNCLMPLAVPDRTFTVAHSYRRYMQKVLPEHLTVFPELEPLKSKRLNKSDKVRLPRGFATQYPEAKIAKLLAPGGLEHLDIDQSVTPGAVSGGQVAAGELLAKFVNHTLDGYGQDRNEPDQVGSSQLSPHLHFGHISSHEVFGAIMDHQSWTLDKLQKPNGKMSGFWGVSEDAEAFLDQLCTWREIGFNMSFRERNYDSIESLPDWTQKTIAEHRDDPRAEVYTLEEFESARTHDELWNAAQRQLVREGRIHNYLRMLWGKKILHWTPSVESALAIMVHLNNKYALDGRDPNSYSGIFWVLGRYDRAWGPQREIFGKIRYMTSDSTARKFSVKQYLKRFGPDAH
ncbi:MAG TPA: deoxyribodipyrimidine photolyase [Planctomycetaceae bacterium]|nr:deoxyribodipyrimidine photolyase [Planctomycetaceae bacterium]